MENEIKELKKALMNSPTIHIWKKNVFKFRVKYGQIMDTVTYRDSTSGAVLYAEYDVIAYEEMRVLETILKYAQTFTEADWQALDHWFSLDCEHGDLVGLKRDELTRTINRQKRGHESATIQMMVPYIEDAGLECNPDTPMNALSRLMMHGDRREIWDELFKGGDD